MFRLLRFGLKAGIATSAFYLTVDNGVWKDSETTTKLYNELSTETSKVLKPYLEQIPISLPEIPRTGSTVTTAQNVWNKAVMSTCKFLAVAPKCAGGYIKEGYKSASLKVQELLEESNKTTTS